VLCKRIGIFIKYDIAHSFIA